MPTTWYTIFVGFHFLDLFGRSKNSSAVGMAHFHTRIFRGITMKTMQYTSIVIVVFSKVNRKLFAIVILMAHVNHAQKIKANCHRFTIRCNWQAPGNDIKRFHLTQSDYDKRKDMQKTACNMTNFHRYKLTTSYTMLVCRHFAYNESIKTSVKNSIELVIQEVQLQRQAINSI